MYKLTALVMMVSAVGQIVLAQDAPVVGKFTQARNTQVSRDLASPAAQYVDAKNGQLLWQFRTNSGVTAVPIAYEVDGVQYIAVQSGWGVDAERMQGALIAAGSTELSLKLSTIRSAWPSVTFVAILSAMLRALLVVGA